MSDIVRPDGDITLALGVSGGTGDHYAKVDESSLDTGDYVYMLGASGGATEQAGYDLYSCGTFTKAATITSVTAWFNLGNYFYPGSSGGSVSFTLKLYTGTTQLATATTSSTGWESITYTGDLTQSEIDGLRLYVYIACVSSYIPRYDSKGDPVSVDWYPTYGYCYMAYAELEGVTGWANIKNIRMGTGSITATDLDSIWFGTSQVAVADVAEFNGVAV